MTEVYRPTMLTHDDDSPDKCRERRRRRILMRRLSSLPSPAPPTVTGILMDPSSDLTRARQVKRQRSSDLDTKPDPHGVSVSLPNCRSSSSADDDDAAAVAIAMTNLTTERAALDRLQREEPLPVHGMMSVTGRSREMEDAVEVRTPLCSPEITRRFPVHFFGVFDGHGGPHVAAMLRSKMPSFITDELMGLSCAALASSVGSCSSEHEEENSGEDRRWGNQWREAMKRAFQRADEVAMATCPCGATESQYSCQPMEVALGGSTAVVALLTPDHIVVGNCGDSRAVLCRGGKAIPLTRDHKPDRSDELARIQALGGRVIFLNGARVEGILAMSRAIGDKYLKPYVTAEPETTIVRRESTDEFVIIASDGLWDVLTNELACDITSQCLREGSPHPGVDLNVSGTHQDEENSQLLYPSRSALAAALLTRLALGRKSSDNISVIVIDLKRRSSQL